MIRRGEIVFVAVLIIFSGAALWQAYSIAGFDKWSSPGVFPMLGDRIFPTRVVFITIALVLYIVAMPALGFLFVSFLFLFASISYLWKKSLWMSMLVSVLSLSIIHIVFRQVFQVVLPYGTLLELFR